MQNIEQIGILNVKEQLWQMQLLEKILILQTSKLKIELEGH